MAKITANQMAALQLIADNKGRVVYFRRNVEGYLRINGNIENAIIKAGLAKGSDNEGVRTWELTEAGHAALAGTCSPTAPQVREIRRHGRTLWMAEGISTPFVDRLRAEGAWIMAQRRMNGTVNRVDSPALSNALKLG